MHAFLSNLPNRPTDIQAD